MCTLRGIIVSFVVVIVVPDGWKKLKSATNLIIVDVFSSTPMHQSVVL